MVGLEELIEEMDALEKGIIEKLKKVPQKRIKSMLKIKYHSFKNLISLPSSIPKKTLKKLGFKPVKLPEPMIIPNTIEEETEEAKELRELEKAIEIKPYASWFLIPIRFKFTEELIRDLAYREGVIPEIFLLKLILQGLIRIYAKKHRNFLLKNGYSFVVPEIDRDLKWEVKFYEGLKNIPSIREYHSGAFYCETGEEAYKKVKEKCEKLKEKLKITVIEVISPWEQKKKEQKNILRSNL